MGKRFTYKGGDYRVDDEGNIHEDGLFGCKVGKLKKDGNFTINKGIFSEETGRICSWTGNVYECGFFSEKKVGKEKGCCFITTACVEHAGLSDDCYELQMMRKFRDEYVHTLPEGAMLLEDYYRTAPTIVRGIKLQDNSQDIFEKLFVTIGKIVALIQSGQNQEALVLCKKEFNILRRNYGSE